MLKGVFLLCVAVTAVSFGQSFDDAVPQNQRAVDFNEYYVYTQEYMNNPVRITNDNLDILFNRSTLVVVHGHGGSRRHQMNADISSSILGKGEQDVNVLVVDWSLQAGYSYSLATDSVPDIAYYLAEFLSTLAPVSVPSSQIHIVGFNLGAHIAGLTGRELSARGTPVARITGLDPSKCNHKLARTDAEYVEVIHTDGGLFGNGLGEQGLGHVDFFPNGGSTQPGCLVHSCCHNRAWQLFAASLGWKDFEANCCTSMSQMRLNTCRGSILRMGNNELEKSLGTCTIYRVNTRSTFPY